MKNKKTLFDISLSLFDEAEIVYSTETAGDNNAVISESGNMPNNNEAANNEGNPNDREAKNNDFRRANNNDFRQAKYKEFIKEYKDLDEARIHNIISSRFKENKQTQQQLEKANGLLSKIASYYGVEDNNDIFDVIISNSNKNQNSENPVAYATWHREVRTNNIYNSWMSEGKALANEYPTFNIEEACNNPLFARMLAGGVTVKAAFFALNIDEIIKDSNKNAADNAQKATIAAIKQNVIRPFENGTAAQSGVTSITDVNKMTAKDRADIARRVAAGETVYL